MFDINFGEEWVSSVCCAVLILLFMDFERFANDLTEPMAFTDHGELAVTSAVRI